jgi:hypothetical protein
MIATGTPIRKANMPIKTRMSVKFIIAHLLITS